MTYHLEPNKPVIDGICFDDLSKVDPSFHECLMARGLVWETEFSIGATTYAGSIIAGTQGDAMAVAFGRGLEEKIVGPYRPAIRAAD